MLLNYFLLDLDGVGRDIEKTFIHVSPCVGTVMHEENITYEILIVLV